MKKFLKKNLPSALLHAYWLLRVVRIKVIKFIPRYDEDELITAHHCDFMQDHRFLSCYNAAVTAGLAVSETIHWRAHVVCWAAERAKKLGGDFVECGVNKGFLSKIAMDYIDFKALPTTFWLMDTFEGLSDKYITSQERDKGVKAGGYESCLEQVKSTFKDYTNVKIVKGTIPDTLPEVVTEKVAFLSIDMNCVIPEIAAAEYFWDKLITGATIILDDYGHSGHEEQKHAFDKFAKKRNVPILCLPTGQGIIIKP